MSKTRATELKGEIRVKRSSRDIRKDPNGPLRMQCECGRADVAVFVNVTTSDGKLLDRVGLCHGCINDSPVKRALGTLGLTIPEAGTEGTN